MRKARTLAHKPVMIDLFAGAGGMSLGLEKSGFKAIGAFEWNPEAAATYNVNLAKDLVVSGFGPGEGDISKIHPYKLAKQLQDKGYKSGDRHVPGDVDLIAAGPPCQGFSRVGRGKLNNLAGRVDAFRHDPRNQLYRRALEIVEAVRPKVVLLENVPGILHLKGNNMAEVISKALEDLGYRVRYTILNAAWYGVPQTRERVFILGFHRGLVLPHGPRFPEIRHRVQAPRGGLTSSDLANDGWRYYLPLSGIGGSDRNLLPPITVAEAISDLPHFRKHLEHVDPWGNTILKGYKSLRALHPPVAYRRGRPTAYQELMRTWFEAPTPGLVTDHFCRWVPRDFWTFAWMESGHNYLDALKVAEKRYQVAKKAFANGELGRKPIPKEFIPPYSDEGFHEKWRKLYRDRPSWTLTAHLGKDTYSHIHYDSTQARAITPREAARLQSFPDSFSFQGNAGDMYRQIGNAVPPLLARALGECILEQLKEVGKDVVADSQRLQAKVKGSRSSARQQKYPIIA